MLLNLLIIRSEQPNRRLNRRLSHFRSQNLSSFAGILTHTKSARETEKELRSYFAKLIKSQSVFTKRGSKLVGYTGGKKSKAREKERRMK